MKAFKLKNLHPLSILIFFIEVLVVCFCADIWALSVVFVLLFVYALITKKAKNILWSLPLAGFILILNPIFYHSGEKILFTVKGYNFTLEAIENGVYSALLIMCTMLIFTVLGSILSEEKFLYVFGRAFPKLSLMVSMIFRHFDVLNTAYTQTKNMAKMNGCYDGDRSLFEKLKTNAVIFEAFTGTALEGSIDTALSLSAKGYYSNNKTKLKKYSFKLTDALFIAVTAAIFALTFLKSYYSLIAVGVLFILPIIFGERRNEQ